MKVPKREMKECLKHCSLSVKKGHWYEFCKNPVTHIHTKKWPDGPITYQAMCSRHANKVTWLPGPEETITKI